MGGEVVGGGEGAWGRPQGTPGLSLRRTGPAAAAERSRIGNWGCNCFTGRNVPPWRSAKLRERCARSTSSCRSSASSPSPTATTARSSRRGSWSLDDARRHAGARAATTARTTTRRIAGCSSAITSPPSPAPGPLIGPVLAAQFGYAPGLPLARRGRRARRRGARLRHPLGLDAPRRQVAGRDRARGDRPASPASPPRSRSSSSSSSRSPGSASRWSTRSQESAWGTFTIGVTIPLALFMGLYMYRFRKGRIAEATVDRRHRAAARGRARQAGRGDSSLGPWFMLSRRAAHRRDRGLRLHRRRCCRCGCCSARATTSARS